MLFTPLSLSTGRDFDYPGSAMPNPPAITGSPLSTSGPWHRILTGPERAGLEALLPGYLAAQRWFGAKARPIAAARIDDTIPLGPPDTTPWLIVVEVDFTAGPGETYLLPLVWRAGPPGSAPESSGAPMVAALSVNGRAGALCAAEQDPAFARGLLADIGAAAERRGARGLLVAAPTGAFGEQAAGAERLVPTLLGAEQSNTSIRFGDRLVLKLFRRTAPGVNPELELGEYLTAVAGFAHTPPTLGAVSYRPDAGGEPLSVACLQRFVANQGDAWQFTLREVAGLLARAAAEPPDGAEEPPAADPSPEGERKLGSYPAAAALLGRRTAELHLALAARPDLPAFAPEPFSPEAQAALDAAVSRQADDSLALLERRLDGLSGPARPLAARLLARRGEIPARLRHLRERPITAARIRIHGDLHLGQVLWTGSDFVFIDFEGEPARPLADRRAKGSALRDVAGVLRSFHYAARSGAAGAAGSTGPERAAERELLLRRWHQAVSEAFLCGYLDAAGAAPFLPQDPRALRELLAVHLLEKALYELAYELNNRPGWVHLPLEGLVDLLDPS